MKCRHTFGLWLEAKWKWGMWPAFICCFSSSLSAESLRSGSRNLAIHYRALAAEEDASAAKHWHWNSQHSSVLTFPPLWVAPDLLSPVGHVPEISSLFTSRLIVSLMQCTFAPICNLVLQLAHLDDLEVNWCICCCPCETPVGLMSFSL